MTDRYLLGIDIGTYSSKGVLTTEEGSVVASHTVPHGMDNPEPGHFEQDADEVWWHDFVEITRRLIETSEVDAEEIGGVGASAIGSCVLPIDEQGKPLRPGILYGIDSRASEEIRYLEEKLGKEKIFSISGSQLTSQASGPKILWIRNNEPEVYKNARWFLTSEAYIVYKLTGVPSIDIYTAGGYAPLYDVSRREWSAEAGELIVPLDRLPEAYWSHEVVGQVTPEASRETGLKEGTPVVAGTTDAAAEALSTGVADSGDMMLMFGSSIFFIMKTRDLIRTKRFWSSNFLEKGAYAFLGGMSTGGSLTTWFRDQFAQLELEQEDKGYMNAYAALAELASRSPPGSNGLIALPYFEGERTPLHDPKAKGMIFGLQLKHTRGDVYRAIMEGVAFGIRHNLEVMKEEGINPQRIYAVGGGTKNRLWLEIVADVCDIELRKPEQQIGASYGDAFLAGRGIGMFDSLSDIKQWIEIQETVQPDSGDSRYDFNYKSFRDLYETNKNLMHDLNDYYSDSE